jgi:hypothetical protein
LLRTAARDIYRSISEIDGVGFTAEVDTYIGPVGILVTDAPGEDNYVIAAGVLTGLELTHDLAAEVAHLNRKHRLGGLLLTPDLMGGWRLVFYCRLERAWLDPHASASQRMVHDILRTLPRQVFNVFWYLTRYRGLPGQPWSLSDRWWVDLVTHI